MRWTLIRLADGPDGTVGILENPDTGRTFFALEEEDQNNASNISRIPAGEYLCKSTTYFKGGYPTFEVTGVPGRSRILFHVGNTEENVSGCIAIGTEVGTLLVKDEDNAKPRRKLAVLNSKAGFDAFMKANSNVEQFALRILDPGTA